MSAVMVGAAAIGAVGSVVAANQGKQKSPATAAFTPDNIQSDQTNAIQNNILSLPSAEQLSTQTNQYNQGQALSLMNQAMPGYSQLAGKLTGLAGNLASNPYSLPPDVQQNLQRQAAEMGVSTGRQGQAGQFSLLRDLGVNELQYGQTQIGEAQGLTSLLASIAPKVNPMSPMSMFLTPAQVSSSVTSNNQIQQGIAQGANNAAAAAGNANASSSAGMWGNITGSLGGLVSSGALNGMFSSGGGSAMGAGGSAAGGAIAGAL